MALEKSGGRCESTINKRTQLTGKLGPDERKREEDRIKAILVDSSTINTNDSIASIAETSTRPILCHGTASQKSKIQKENQGQGHQSDRNLSRIDTTTKIATTTRGKADGTAVGTESSRKPRKSDNTPNASASKRKAEIQQAGSSDESCGDDSHQYDFC